MQIRRYSLPEMPRWAAASAEISLMVAAALAYFLIRGITESSEATALANADRLIRFEEWLGIAWEGAVQGWIESSHALVTVVNWIYIWGHWPLIIVVALWLLRVAPAEYRITRNAFLISGGIGLIIFALFPVAPPRLTELDVVDTVSDYSRAYRVLQPPALVNQYAAMPSLHFGWNLLIAITIWRVASRRWLRVVAVLIPPLMFAAIVLTANHFIIDAPAGAAVALTGYTIALRRAPGRWPLSESQPRTAPPPTQHDP